MARTYRKAWSTALKKEDETVREERVLDMLAKRDRGVKQIKRGGFHTPRKRASGRRIRRHREVEDLKDVAAAYNAGEEVEYE